MIGKNNCICVFTCMSSIHSEVKLFVNTQSPIIFFFYDCMSIAHSSIRVLVFLLLILLSLHTLRIFWYYFVVASVFKIYSLKYRIIFHCYAVIHHDLCDFFHCVLLSQTAIK